MSQFWHVQQPRRWHFAASTFVTQVIIFVTHNLSIGTCNPLPPFYGAMCRDVCSHWPLRPTRPLRLLLTLSTRKKPTQQESLLHASIDDYLPTYNGSEPFFSAIQ